MQDQALSQPDTQTAADNSSELLTDTDDFYSAWSTIPTPSDQREIIFIDTRVADYQTLLSGINPGIEAVLLDPTRDGLEQMAEILGERTGLDAIHIISHGNQAELWLGTSHLTLNSMNGEYADELAVIGKALADTGDILIYGCNFGQGASGREAASRLHNSPAPMWPPVSMTPAAQSTAAIGIWNTGRQPSKRLWRWMRRCSRTGWANWLSSPSIRSTTSSMALMA